MFGPRLALTLGSQRTACFLGRSCFICTVPPTLCPSHAFFFLTSSPDFQTLTRCREFADDSSIKPTLQTPTSGGEGKGGEKNLAPSSVFTKGPSILLTGFLQNDLWQQLFDCHQSRCEAMSSFCIFMLMSAFICCYQSRRARPQLFLPNS